MRLCLTVYWSQLFVIPIVLIFGNIRMLCKFCDNLDLGGGNKPLRICYNKCEKIAEMNKLKSMMKVQLLS